MNEPDSTQPAPAGTRAGGFSRRDWLLLVTVLVGLVFALAFTLGVLLAML